VAQQEQSAYRRAARQRWPNAVIRGDGRFAIYCPITGNVRLYELALLAAADIGRECSNWRCAENHLMVELKPLYPAPRKVISDWE
jgi:hypothetical protein